MNRPNINLPAPDGELLFNDKSSPHSNGHVLSCDETSPQPVGVLLSFDKSTSHTNGQVLSGVKSCSYPVGELLFYDKSSSWENGRLLIRMELYEIIIILQLSPTRCIIAKNKINIYFDLF